MKNKKISGGYARLGQVMILIFFVPFLLLCGYLLITKDLIFEGIIFLVVTMIVMLLIIRKIFMYGDIYLNGEDIIIKKLLYKKTISTKTIQEINKTLFPFTYFIRFNDESKVLFQADSSDILKNLFSIDTERTLNSLKSNLIEENKHFSRRNNG